MPDYEEWNVALADAVFGGQSAYQPVFLDLEDDVLIAAAIAAGMPAGTSADRAEKDLAAAVREKLDLRGETGLADAFRRWRLDVLRWKAQLKSDPTAVPPIIALLAVFSRAAEKMGQDAKLASNNYYDRLLALLGLTPLQRPRLEQSFRHDSEGFWRILNGWLETWEGEAGFPTAYSFSHRYVGIPMSQALVRAADRAQFPVMFADLGLDPGTVVTPGDMAEFIKEWVRRGKGTLSIKQAITTELGRQVLAEAAVVALSNWGGDQPGAPGAEGRPRERKAMLRAAIRPGLFTGPRLLLGLGIRIGLGTTPGSVQTWHLQSAKAVPSMDFVADGEGTSLTDLPLVGADPRSLIEGEVTLCGGDGVAAVRRPRPIVVLVSRADGSHLEVDRVRMGEAHLVLVNEGAQRRNGTHPYAPGGPLDVAGFLSRAAQPGFRRLEAAELEGLPPGWTAYHDVVIMNHVAAPNEQLEPLEAGPLTALVMSDGLRLPGLEARWLAGVPIRVRASVDQPDVAVVLMSEQDGRFQVVQEWSQPDRAQMVCELADLEPGRYRLQMTVPKGKRRSAVQTLGFQVVSADAPSRMARPPLLYGEDCDLPAELSACAEHGPDICRRPPRPVAAELPAQRPGWRFVNVPATEGIEMGPVAMTSCAVTGSHHFIIPLNGRQGTCKYCGLPRTFRKTLRAKPGVRTESGETPRLPALDATGHADGFDLLRAIAYLSSGSIRSLDRLLRGFEDSALGVNNLMHALESLAVVNLQRDPAMRPVEWSAAKPGFYPLAAGGGWLLGGALNDSQVRQWRELSALDGKTHTTDMSSWLPRCTVRGGSEAVHRAAEAMGVAVAECGGDDLLERLRPLSQVAAQLPRADASAYTDVSTFVVGENRWQPVLSPSGAGLYRVDRGFSVSYFLRDETDVVDGTLAWVDAYLGKHVAAGMAGTPLIAYQPDEGRLVLPLGADLPALYARGAALASGWISSRVRGAPQLVYSGVTDRTARAINALMKG